MLRWMPPKIKQQNRTGMESWLWPILTMAAGCCRQPIWIILENESNGKLYVLSNGKLYVLCLPLLESPTAFNRDVPWQDGVCIESKSRSLHSWESCCDITVLTVCEGPFLFHKRCTFNEPSWPLHKKALVERVSSVVVFRSVSSFNLLDGPTFLLWGRVVRMSWR